MSKTSTFQYFQQIQSIAIINGILFLNSPPTKTNIKLVWNWSIELYSLKRSSLLNANEYIFIDHRDKGPPTSANADCAKYPLVRNFIHIIK